VSAERTVLVEGLAERPPAPSPTPLPPKPKLRLKQVDRQQVRLEVVDTDRLMGRIMRYALSWICWGGWI